ncbi:MAG TPA: hypothetical protein DCZ91_22845 [Lachnospiraceae bacterium]|nr:hypothetical protein [Lachnospiraceae bacterium]
MAERNIMAGEWSHSGGGESAQEDVSGLRRSDAPYPAWEKCHQQQGQGGIGQDSSERKMQCGRLS